MPADLPVFVGGVPEFEWAPQLTEVLSELQASSSPDAQRPPTDVLPFQTTHAYKQGEQALSPSGQWVTGQRSLVQAVAAFTSTGSFDPANWRRLTEDLSGVYVTRPTAQGIALVQALIFGGK